jgi:hypothetical protein
MAALRCADVTLAHGYRYFVGVSLADLSTNARSVVYRKGWHVAQSLNPGQTTLFWECFEISNRVAREGYKVEFITENNRVFRSIGSSFRSPGLATMAR